MIDFVGELENYPPVSIDNLESSGRDISENMRNSITLYNKSLESLRNKSEDIAIIELKKAIAVNPEFYEAMNLLALCYVKVGDKAKAEEIFQKVIAAESNSVKALKYMERMNSSDDASSAVKNRRKKQAAAGKTAEPMPVKAPGPVRETRPVHEPQPVRETSRLSPVGLRNMNKDRSGHGMLKYAAGFAVGVAVVALLNLSGIFSKDIPDTKQEPDPALLQALDQAQKQIDSLKADIAGKEKQNENLQKNSDSASAAANYYKSVIRLYETENFYDKKDYEGAADALLLLKATEFQGADKEKFNQIYGQVMPAAAWSLFEKGIALVSPQRKYTEALEKLNKVPLYQENFERMDAVYYNIGKCYQNLNDSRNAVAMYQKVISTYPQSTYANWADVRLKEIASVP